MAMRAAIRFPAGRALDKRGARAHDGATVYQERAMPAEGSSRLLIVVLSILALSAILGLVDNVLHRIIFGALVMGFLTWSAYTSATQPTKTVGPPPGIRERRKSHTLRHRVNEFLRDIRRLDAIAKDISQGHVSQDTGDKALDEIEKRLHELVKQMRGLAGRGM